MGKIIAVINQKGGVGKTTTAVNLSASIAIANRRTLVVDFDPQGNASSALGIDKTNLREKKTIYQALVGQVNIKETILKTEIDGLFISPTDTDLTGAEVELVSAFARESKLKNILTEIKGNNGPSCVNF